MAHGALAWQTNGAAWQALLDDLEQMLRHEIPAGVDERALRVTRERWDMPEIQARWPSGHPALSRSLTVSLGPGAAQGANSEAELTLVGSAWLDAPSLGERRWHSAGFGTFAAVLPPDDQSGHALGKSKRLKIRNALRKAITAVSNWTVDDLDRRDSLPPLPLAIRGSESAIAADGDVTVRIPNER